MIARAALMSALIVLSGCNPGSAGTDAGQRATGSTRRVVLITIDTLRANQLGCYGYERATSPFVDGLARDGIQVMRAYAPVPRTVPSHMSMLTGLYPHSHGAIRNPYTISRENVPSLPAFLRGHGYATAAFVSIPFLDPTAKKLPGFEHIESPPPGEAWQAEETLSRAATWAREQGGNEFFLWVHTFDTHRPYDSPPPYASMFWDGPALAYRPPLRGLLTGPPPTARQAAYTTARYDGAIRYTDDSLRRFFAETESVWRAPPLLIVTADHGEVLHEHSRDFGHAYFHGKFPYNQSLHVPLIVHWPGRLEPGRRETPVNITGLAATIADLLFGGGFSGEVESFAPLLRYEKAAADRSLFAFSPKMYPEEKIIPAWRFRRWEAWSVLRWPWHLIHHPSRGDVLYDVAGDPLELTDVARIHPRRTARLRDEVIEHFANLPAVPVGAAPVSARLRAQLHSLGYAQ